MASTVTNSGTVSNSGTLPTRAPWDLPYAATSPYNIGIGTGAQWDGTSAAALHLHSIAGVINTTDWSLPTFVGQASDPFVQIVGGGAGNSPTAYVHAPANAQPPGGADRNMSFFDVTNPGTVYTYWNVNFNNGSNVYGGMTSGISDEFATTGDGFANPSWSQNQSGDNYSGGVITPYDLQNGTIAHALRMALGINDEAYPAGATNWDDTNQFPVNHTDYSGDPANGGAYHGIIPADSTFGIPASVDLSKLGLSQGGMMLAKALQDYGGYWEDTAGSSQLTVFSEPTTASSPLMGEMSADFQKLMPYIDLMTNQSAATENGGGAHPYMDTTPIAAAGLTDKNNYAGAMNAGQVASANDAVITQPGQTITDASGNAWAIYNGEVELNAVLDSSTSGVSEMAYVTGQVWYQDAGGWHQHKGTQQGWAGATGSPLPAGTTTGGGAGGTGPTPSPDNTTITTSGSITDAAGNVWTIIAPNGQIGENGQVIGGWGVAEMAYEAGTVWQFNGTDWYSWNGSAWSAGTTVSPIPAASGTGNNGSAGTGGNGTGGGMTPLSGLTWPTHTVTWAFANAGTVSGLGTVTSAISDPTQNAQITAGISAWAKVSGITLQQVSNPAQANIEVGYGNPSGLIGENIWAYNPSTSQYTGDLVLLQDPAIGGGLTTDASGMLSYNDGVELGQLATHEFGVGIGLAEGSGADAASVMNHVLTASNRVPDAADIAAAQSLYGAPPKPAFTASPDNTVITAGGTITDSAGNVWSIQSPYGSGQVAVNGTVIGGWGVTEMAFEKGLIWQFNGTDWYSIASPTGTWSAGTTVSPVPAALQSNDLTLAVPQGETVAAGGTVAVSGAVITDPWAATQTGSMKLTVSDSAGSLIIAGQTVAAGRSAAFTGTLQQLNADLAGLTYKAGSGGSDTVVVDVVNQAGVEATKAVPVTVTKPAITLPASNPTPTITASNSQVSGVGSFTAFLGGSGDSLTLTGGAERAYLFGGNDAVSTGAAADEVVLASTGNTVDLGGGANAVVETSAGGNTIVMPSAGAGTVDIWGNVLQDGDKLDFHAALANAGWSGSAATLGQYLSVSTASNGTDAVVAVSGSTVATLHGAAGLSMATLQQHAAF